MLAVFETGSKQYKAKVGDKLIVEKLEGEVGAEVNFANVLMLAEGEKVECDGSKLDKKVVKAKILDQFKGEKVIVFKKKRRHNYRRKNGHRQQLTQVEIISIN